MRKIGLVVAGAVFGIALVLACERHREGGGDDRTDASIGAGADAQAAPSDCDAWQIAYLEDEILQIGTNSPHDLPAGWEPFVVYGSAGGANVFLRRCRP